MGTYRVKYKMKGQVWKEITIEVSSGHGSSPRGGAGATSTHH